MVQYNEQARGQMGVTLIPAHEEQSHKSSLILTILDWLKLTAV